MKPRERSLSYRSQQASLQAVGFFASAGRRTTAATLDDIGFDKFVRLISEETLSRPPMPLRPPSCDHMIWVRFKFSFKSTLFCEQFSTPWLSPKFHRISSAQVFFETNLLDELVWLTSLGIFVKKFSGEHLIERTLGESKRIVFVAASSPKGIHHRWSPLCWFGDDEKFN